MQDVEYVITDDAGVLFKSSSRGTSWPTEQGAIKAYNNTYPSRHRKGTQQMPVFVSHIKPCGYIMFQRYAYIDQNHWKVKEQLKGDRV